MTPISAETTARFRARTRSERVTIRPFESIDNTDSALETVRLLVGDVSHQEGSIVLDDDSLGKATLKLALPTADELRKAVEGIPLPADSCAVVVMAASRTHRASAVLLKERLTSDPSYPTEFALNRAESDLIFDDCGGFRVTVALVLLNDVEPAPLKPSIAGTWICRSVFNLMPQKAETSFSPEELTEEVRELYGLPKGVLRFITFDDNLLGAEDLSDGLRVYVEPNVLGWMLRKDTDQVALQLQTELAVMAYDATIQQIVREIRIEHHDAGRTLTEADIAAYPAVQRFFVYVAGKCQVGIAEFLRMASDGQLIRPFLEASFDVTDQTLAALKG